MVAIGYLCLASCHFVPGRLSKKHGERTRLLVRTLQYLPSKSMRLRSPIPSRPQNRTLSTRSPREYWIFYRGPGFSTDVWFGSTPAPLPLCRQLHVSLSQSSCVSPIELTGEVGGGGGRGAESYDHKKAWPSINQSILSDLTIKRSSYWAGIFKRVWGPGIDSKEWILPAYVAWRAGTITLFLPGS